jgi:hypothetical protein
MQKVSGGGGVGQKAAIQLLNLWRDKAAQNIKRYNTTAQGLYEFSPKVKGIYPQIELEKRKGPSLDLGKLPEGIPKCYGAKWQASV